MMGWFTAGGIISRAEIELQILRIPAPAAARDAVACVAAAGVWKAAHCGGGAAIKAPT
jgi:hypothetical protein